MPNTIFDNPLYTGVRDDYRARLARYQYYRAYYNGTAYDSNYVIKNSQKLYAGTRTLFSPLRRVVRVDESKIPASWALDEQETSKTTIERVKALRKMVRTGVDTLGQYRMGAELAYNRGVKYGAVAGEFALLLSGEPKLPIITAFRPDEVQCGVTDAGMPYAIIIKQAADSVFKRYEYAQVITPDTITTYKDGTLYGFGNNRAEMPNAYGFVPLVFSHYIYGEDGRGEPAFAGITELLDRVNEIASLMLDVIARNAEPLMIGTGVESVSRDASNDAILTPNADAKFYTVNPNLAVEETLKFIQDVRAEFKTLLPQLAIDELRSATDLAYDTVQMLLMEYGDYIVSVRSQVDPAIEQIERWLLEANGGIPDDYALWRDRSWLTLSEKQQIELEQLKQSLEASKKALDAPQAQPGASNATGNPAGNTPADAAGNATDNGNAPNPA